MNHPTGSWPKRLLDRSGLETGLDPRLETELQTGLRQCAELEVSESFARRVARRAIEELDARQARVGPQRVLSSALSPALSPALSKARRLLRPRMVFAALALALLVQLGVAVAEELGPRAAERVGAWFDSFERKVASLGTSHLWRGPAPTVGARRENVQGSAAPSAVFTVAEPAVEPAQEQPSVAAQVASVPSGPVARRRAVVSSRPSPAPAAVALSDPLGHEAALVSRVVALAAENPPGALGLLGEYWRDYPAGALRGEAAVAEVSALRSLGREGEALARLDGWVADRFRGMSEAGDELALSRLELMVGAGRCAEALPLLDRRLAVESTSRSWGRALLARAACKGKLGDSNGNRVDLERYLRELPGGPRAAQVRRALGNHD